MTVFSLIKKYGATNDIDDLYVLLTDALKKNKEYLYAHPEYRLLIKEWLKYKYYLWQYRRGYSVAAIIHHKEFYGLDFYVNRHVLIPRPETEMMVEEALIEMSNVKCQIKSKIQNPNDKNILLIDVGTGSGCIPIAVLKEMAKLRNGEIGKLENSEIKTIATDISRQALRVAKKNAKRYGAKIKFFRGNLIEPIILKINEMTNKKNNNFPISSFRNFDTIIITANLPYLTEKQFKSESSIQREPKTALVTGNGGLSLYEELLKQIQTFLKLLTVNSSLLIFLEIDPSQSQRITTVIKQYFPTAKTEIKKDLAGRGRMVRVKMTSK